MSKTKLCKKCKTEIPKKAKFCPNCKQNQGSGCLTFGILFLVICFFIPILFGSDDEEESGQKIFVQESELNSVFSSPNDYKGKYIDISGKVFNVENSNEKTQIQVFCDPINSEKNAYVVYNGIYDLNDNEYIKFTGKIKGSETGVNAFGGIVSCIEIEADTIEKSNYIDVCSPTIKEIVCGKEVNQFGYSIVIDKVQIAKDETRVYVTVKNKGGSDFSFYEFNSKVTQGESQYETQPNYVANYQELQSDLKSGITTNGIITFPKIDENSPFTIYLDGSSDNWDEDIQEYVFEIQ